MRRRFNCVSGSKINAVLATLAMFHAQRHALAVDVRTRSAGERGIVLHKMGYLIKEASAAGLEPMTAIKRRPKMPEDETRLLRYIDAASACRSEPLVRRH